MCKKKCSIKIVKMGKIPTKINKLLLKGEVKKANKLLSKKKNHKKFMKAILGGF